MAVIGVIIESIDMLRTAVEDPDFGFRMSQSLLTLTAEESSCIHDRLVFQVQHFCKRLVRMHLFIRFLIGSIFEVARSLTFMTESSIPLQVMADSMQGTVTDSPSSYTDRSTETRLLNERFPLHALLIVILGLGSGKTVAFAIPMLTFISTLPPFTDENRHLGPYPWIMAPTGSRELTQQIECISVFVLPV
jgi:hypothetical protein